MATSTERDTFVDLLIEAARGGRLPPAFQEAAAKAASARAGGLEKRPKPVKLKKK